MSAFCGRLNLSMQGLQARRSNDHGRADSIGQCSLPCCGFFLVREALVEMDVPTRQSYVMAIVQPAERTRASGITNVTRNVGWALGPPVASVVMQHVAFAGPLFIGGVLKIVYDVLLYRAFRHLRPPEERSA